VLAGAIGCTESGSGVGGGSDGASSKDGGGSSGDNGGGDDSGSTSGDDSGSTRGDDSGSTSGGDSGSSGGDDAGAASKCTYPSGPYGVDQDNIVDPSVSWQGYPAGSSSVGTVRIEDFFDCDGKKGVNAILVDTSALWCGPCNQEASQLEAQMQSTWKTQGVVVISLIWQNASRGPASMSDVTAWKNRYGLTDVNVCLDDQFTFAHPNSSVALPRNVLIDPRTMKIVAKGDGYGGQPDPVVSQLAVQNGG
jgi:hypothetical protein